MAFFLPVWGGRVGGLGGWVGNGLGGWDGWFSLLSSCSSPSSYRRVSACRVERAVSSCFKRLSFLLGLIGEGGWVDEDEREAVLGG